LSWKIVLGRAFFGLAFAAAGLWVARVSVLAFQARRRWRSEGVVVDGRIVAFEERADTDPSDRRKLFAPVVDFKTMEGAPFRFVSSRAERPNPYTVGQTVPVRYMRLEPAKADLDAATGSLLVPLATAVMAIVFLGVALLPLLLPAPTPR
jgi:hypothetical protein